MFRFRRPHATPFVIALFFSVFFTLSAGGLPPVQAAIKASDAPYPVQKPVPPAPIALTREEVERLERLLRTAKKGNWDRVTGSIAAIENPLARKVVTWLRLQQAGSGASFYEIARFLDDNPRWPLQERLARRAETAMDDDVPAAQALSWFESRPPQSGDGMMRFGEALWRSGRRDAGAEWFRKSWRQTSLSRSAENRVRTLYGNALGAEDHRARLEALLWAGDAGGVTRMKRHVSTNAWKLADARIRLRHNRRGVDGAIARVPSEYQAHPGLLYERTRWRRRRGRHAETWPLIQEAAANPAPYVNQERWWTERHLQTRNALKARDYQAAYSFASGHDLERGAGFAQAEFLSGWIALRYLGDARAAYEHFSHLSQNVSFPISRSRGLYWMGRAAEADKQRTAAIEHYRDAAKHAKTYYGQLAMERLTALGAATDRTLRLPATPQPTQLDKAAFLRSELARATVVAADFADEWVVRTFVMHMAQTAQDASELALVSDLARELDYMHYAVRVGKHAAQRYMPITDYAYPLIALPPYEGKGREPERALVLALMRQESEFNTSARSHAKAKGLMQLLSGTARITARRHGLIYRRSWLTSKPEYNSQLGRAHLSDLLEEFDGSYVLTLAAYNAGPHRVTRWLREYGDPRKPGVDPVDWVETIPFSETRNYVQRIMETLTVYRNLLSGKDHTVSLSEDLKRTSAYLPNLQAAPSQTPRTARLLPLSRKKGSEGGLFSLIPQAVAAPSSQGTVLTPKTDLAAPTSRSLKGPLPVRKPFGQPEAALPAPVLPRLAPRTQLARQKDLEYASIPQPVRSPRSIQR